MAEPPEASEFTKIFAEKSMETCNFLKILQENFRFFKILYNFIEFFAKIWTKFLKISENAFEGVRGRSPSGVIF